MNSSGELVAYICDARIPGTDARHMCVQSGMTAQPGAWADRSVIGMGGDSLWSVAHLFGENYQSWLKSGPVKSGVIGVAGFHSPRQGFRTDAVFPTFVCGVRIGWSQIAQGARS